MFLYRWRTAWGAIWLLYASGMEGVNESGHSALRRKIKMSKPPPFDEKTAQRVEAVYASSDENKNRALVLKVLDPQVGESVMDLGSGPGFYLSEIAKAIGPSGSACGVDSNASMLGLAERRCAGMPQVTLKEGEATTLPTGDGEFDAALVTQVYEYVIDIPGALSELYRILRPGGRAVILDTDWGSLVWNAKDMVRAERLFRAWDRHLADSHLPRTLSSHLKRAGFEIESREAIPILNPEYDPDTYSYRMLSIIVPFVIRHGGIEKEDAKAWAEELKELGNEGKYFFSLNRYLFSVRKS
jgi:ubiquinone/menaquinone biosynthesis C-methylase UbiE